MTESNGSSGAHLLSSGINGAKHNSIPPKLNLMRTQPICDEHRSKQGKQFARTISMALQKDEVFSVSDCLQRLIQRRPHAIGVDKESTELGVSSEMQ